MSWHSSSLRAAPLLSWGEALRAAKTRRTRLARRMVLAAGLGAAVLSTAAFPPTPRLVWNATPSAPRGLYGVFPGAVIRPGDIVIARVPRRYRRLFVIRRYLAAGVPLVKRVLAEAGGEVCARDHEILLNQRLVAKRRSTDGTGRAMPLWQGCVTLKKEELFLLMDDPASLDGRYLGPIDRADIIGKATLLWRA